MATARILVAAAVIVAGILPAAAQTADQRPVIAIPETSDKPFDEVSAVLPPSIRDALSPGGEPGRARSFLHGHGIDYSLTYIGETLADVAGGARRGAIAEGRFDLQLDADLGRLAGWSGASVHGNLYQIHGTGLSRHNVGNLMTTSGIEALPSTRLYELWLEQKFLDGKLTLRGGQLAADTEFLVSQTAGLFVNGTYGWPEIAALDLPSGGPAYPLATPSIRAKFTPTNDVTLMAAIFNGDPAGRSRASDDAADPQRRNRTGTGFRLRDPALLIGEGAYAYRLGGDASPLPGTVKLGAWSHLGRFDDQRRDATGLWLADPAASGIARRLRGNGGLYAVVDQVIYHVPGSVDQGISVFARLSGAPGDRNLVDLYADGGIAFKGLFTGRSNDTFGISAAYLRISDRVRDADLDRIVFSGVPGLRRKAETLIEATYQAEIASGWTVQPDVQYVFRPGAGAEDPLGRRIRNAAIVGARTTIRY